MIQVNGKVRSKVNAPVNSTEQELKDIVLADEKVKTWIKDSPIKSFVVVPNKLINIVI